MCYNSLKVTARRWKVYEQDNGKVIGYVVEVCDFFCYEWKNGLLGRFETKGEAIEALVTKRKLAAR